MPAAAQPGLPWQLRAVQIDLARQIETLEFVKSYIDQAREYGFNTIVLYLEGRIRTDSFPYPTPDYSYTLADMETIVRHARQAGMEVIPVVTSLGHCELFVKHPELAHLAEERSGRTRFGDTNKSTLCPSQDEIYGFLKRYLTEITQVFTGPYLHVGCDEAWNIGFCDLCEPRRREIGLDGIFMQHIYQMASITHALGKRMLIWDDMFEVFPNRLQDIPRETIMCHWNYNPVVEREGSFAHFRNLRRWNWLAEYERLGLDVLVCPWVINTQNVVSMSDYAHTHRVLGGILTQWEEKKNRFYDESAPVVAFTGQLWSGKTFDIDLAWASSIRLVVGETTPDVASAVRLLSELSRPNPSLSIQSYLAGALSVYEYTQRASIRLGLQVLKSARENSHAKYPNPVLDDLEISSRICELKYILRELIPAVYDPRRSALDLPRLRTLADYVRSTLAECEQVRLAQWERIRPQVRPELAGAYVHELMKALESVWERLDRQPGPSDWLLVLRLFLPDDHGRPRIKVSIAGDDGDRTILLGTFKPDSTTTGVGGNYTVQALFSAASPPRSVRFEAWGYGGQGISFLQLRNPDITLIPERAQVVQGQVSNPNAVLADDSQWAFLGDPGYHDLMSHPELASGPAAIDIALVAREFDASDNLE